LSNVVDFLNDDLLWLLLAVFLVDDDDNDDIVDLKELILESSLKHWLGLLFQSGSGSGLGDGSGGGGMSLVNWYWPGV